MMTIPPKPTKAELAAAVHNTVPDLLALGYGITNMAERTTNAASALSRDEYIEGGKRLTRNGAYRSAFGRSRAHLGLQPETLAGSAVWALPSPSGLHANQQLQDLVALLTALREWVST
ncbi:hypothetical protein [Gemmatimonas sp.]|jgi:TDG/mug DNA glycosylase family protein|uniref:hypothetical protein n=1 Tax=Gemmatimonas sp. TaxID=1962908 RepID=UPI0037C176F9